MEKTLNSCKSEKGFTLVELAVVMIIIGLLIGGILKGQELITNAQISSTIAQAKGIDGAASTFRDAYSQFPGDMPNATSAVRLPNCAGLCASGGDGDSGLENAPGSAAAAAAGEELGFWHQLNAADLVSGVQSNGTPVWGEQLPAANVGGGLTVGRHPGGGALGANAAARGGHYVTLQAAPGGIGAGGAGTGLLSASQAARIDRKMDDGNGVEGSVFHAGGAVCSDGAGQYLEAADDLACEMFIRIAG